MKRLKKIGIVILLTAVTASIPYLLGFNTGKLNCTYAWIAHIFYSDTISENTPGAGVTIDGTLIKDGNITANVTGDVSGSSGSCTGNATTATTAGACTGNSATVTGLSVTADKTLTVQKTMTITSPDDTSVITLPAGTKTLLATDGSAASLSNFPTLNQDTTGSSGSCTGNAATATTAGSCSGNAATATTAGSITGNLSGDVTSTGMTTAYSNVVPANKGGAGTVTGVLKANGSGTVSAATSGTDYAPGTSALTTGIVKSTTSTGALSIAEAADFPTLNQSTTGNAATATAAGKSTNLTGGNSTTQLGSMPYQSDTDTTTLLAPNTTSTKKFLTQTGDGTNGAAPAWSELSAGDIGTVPVANGGTGITSYLSGDMLYASGTTTLYKLAKGSASQVLAMNSGATAPEWTTPVKVAYYSFNDYSQESGTTNYTTVDLDFSTITENYDSIGISAADAGSRTEFTIPAGTYMITISANMTASADAKRLLFALSAGTNRYLDVESSSNTFKTFSASKSFILVLASETTAYMAFGFQAAGTTDTMAINNPYVKFEKLP